MSSQTDPLRALANRWVLKARDHSRQSKSTGDEKLSSYHRGIAETYHKAALELAEVLQSGTVKSTGMLSPVPASPSAAAPSTGEPEPAPIPVSYVALPVKEVIMMLEYAGISPRDVNMHKDNVCTAVFSRWQPFSDEERLAKLRSADARVVVLATGRLRDTGDPFIDFAFRDTR